jgi:hypothetical protein
LTISNGEHGEAALSPFLALILTNISTSPCVLDGYPGVAMIGNTIARTGAPTEPSHRLPDDVEHGIYARPDPGPRRVDLLPGQSAMFYVSTDIGTGAHIVVIHQIQVTLLPGGTSLTTTLSGFNLAADVEPGQRVRVGITAIQIQI